MITNERERERNKKKRRNISNPINTLNSRKNNDESVDNLRQYLRAFNIPRLLTKCKQLVHRLSCFYTLQDI